MTQIPRLRPLAIGEIIDAGVKIYQRHWRVLFAIAATVIVPIHLLSFGLNLYAIRQAESFGFGDLDTSGAVDFDLSDFYSFIAVAFIAGIIGIVALLVVNAATLRAVADGYMGLKPDRSSSLSLALRRLGTLVGNSLLQGLAVAGVLAIPFVILAFALAVDDGGAGSGIAFAVLFLAAFLVIAWLFISWTVAVPAIVVEQAGAAKALGRSMRLIRGRWWPVFGVIVLVTIIRWVIGGVAGIAVGVVVFAAPESFVLSAIVDTIQTIAIDIVLLPFAAAITAVLYFDLRVRKEGFDLELLARSVGSTLPDLPPPTTGGWSPPGQPPTSDPSRWSPQPPMPPGSGQTRPPMPPQDRPPWETEPPNGS